MYAFNRCTHSLNVYKFFNVRKYECTYVRVYIIYLYGRVYICTCIVCKYVVKILFELPFFVRF